MKILKVDDSHINVEKSTIVTVAPQLGGGMLIVGLVFGFFIGKSFDGEGTKKKAIRNLKH